MQSEIVKNTPAGNAFGKELRELLRKHFPNVETDQKQNAEAIGLLTELTCRVGIAYGVQIGCMPVNVFDALSATLRGNMELLLGEIASGVHTKQ